MKDMITFPLMFLVAFVLVAAFLENLTEALKASVGKRSLIEDMMEQLYCKERLDEMDDNNATKRNGPT